jgi:hypothetical protein
MRLLLAVTLAIAVAPRLAIADATAGLVVTGEPKLQAPVSKHLHRWLSHHGFNVVSSPLTSDAIDETATCLIAGDPHCARAVVEAHATTDSVLYVRIELAAHINDVTLDTYWFVRGHEAVGERRVCEQCDEDGWRAVADRMMDALLPGTAQMGKLALRSSPSNLTVLLDNKAVGVTPVELDAPPGSHTIRLLSDGATVAERTIDLVGGDTLNLTLKATPARHADHPSRLVPLLLIGVGVAALASGLGLIYEGQQNGKDVKYVYPFDTPEGIGLATVGVGVMAGGFVLLVQSRSSTPVAAISPHGAYLGWQARF